MRSKLRNHLPTIFLFGLGSTLSLYFLINLVSSKSQLAPSTLFRALISTTYDPSLDALDSVPGLTWVSPTKKRFLSRQQDPQRLTSSFRSIPIDGALPSTEDLLSSSTLIQAWDTAFNSLSSAASAGISNSASSPIRGVPGTGITTTEEARQLQDHLDCMSGSGTWVYDEDGDERRTQGSAGLTVHKHSGVLASCDRAFYKHAPAHPDEEGGWAVRESLKYRWVPSESCKATAPPSMTPSPLTRRAFCTLLAHKSTVLVGDVPQYSLHDLLLDWTSLTPQSCYGDLYCKEHSLCGDVLRHPNDNELERWTADERVFNRIPEPPASHSHSDDPPRLDKRTPGKSQKSPSYGTMLRYRRSDGMRGSAAFVNPTYVNPATGVREINQGWTADARRSDIVILSKPPLPFPEKGANETFDEWWYGSEGGGGAGRSGEEDALRLIEAARRITEDTWLPEMLATLGLLRSRPTPRDILIVYRGGWRTHSDCGVSAMVAASDDDEWNSPGDGPPPYAFPPTLREILFKVGGGGSGKSKSWELNDLHSTFHNLQTIFQNHILRTTILPHYGIPYLDLESPLSVWRSGLVGGSASPPFSFVDPSWLSSNPQFTFEGTGSGLRSGSSGDCLRYCLPSPGMAVEEAFLGGLMRVFERGWGTRERKGIWVGDGFENIKEREKKRGHDVP